MVRDISCINGVGGGTKKLAAQQSFDEGKDGVFSNDRIDIGSIRMCCVGLLWHTTEINSWLVPGPIACEACMGGGG